MNRTNAIRGLRYVPEFLTPDEERVLVRQIGGETWDVSFARKRQQYGYEYDHESRSLGLVRARPFPFWLHHLAERCHRRELTDKRPDQVIINAYDPGQGIGKHVDSITCFDGTVVVVSLLSSVLLRFERGDEVRNILLEPRSALVLQGDARYEWTHEILKEKEDLIDGKRIERNRRISVTLRKIRFPALART